MKVITKVSVVVAPTVRAKSGSILVRSYRLLEARALRHAYFQQRCAGTLHAFTVISGKYTQVDFA